MALREPLAAGLLHKLRNPCARPKEPSAENGKDSGRRPAIAPIAWLIGAAKEPSAANRSKYSQKCLKLITSIQSISEPRIGSPDIHLPLRFGLRLLVCISFLSVNGHVNSPLQAKRSSQPRMRWDFPQRGARPTPADWRGGMRLQGAVGDAISRASRTRIINALRDIRDLQVPNTSSGCSWCRLQQARRAENTNRNRQSKTSIGLISAPYMA
ncbi:uncharacterized protein VTP21DRAFT_3883 [Calcarisporiella thermophila]|uniref:uncharacterized protein n=1 Tax=Calcarisporiella thermophila TaxID=911321 RepID=UPI003742C161